MCCYCSAFAQDFDKEIEGFIVKAEYFRANTFFASASMPFWFAELCYRRKDHDNDNLLHCKVALATNAHLLQLKTPYTPKI